MTGLGFRNPAVQHLRRLCGRRGARLDAGAFVIEGPVLLREAFEAGVEIEAVYVDEREVASQWAQPLLEQAERLGVRRIELAPGVLSSAVDTVTPQPIAAIGRIVTRPTGFFTSTANGMILVLAGVADPGNAGTILRSAEAAGVKGLIVCQPSVDMYSPKTVRASAGSLFRVPMAVVNTSAETILPTLQSAGFVVLGSKAEGGAAYDEYDLTTPVAIVVGNEAHGLSPAVEDVLDGFITIPMVGANESLNVAMAATVICFEMARQRRSR